MLFDFHNEHKISIKRLSDADLKRSAKSNQTHIGLSNHSLTYIQDNKKEYSAMLIYGAYCDILKCEVGRIQRKNGTFDAPNVKSNGRNGESIVRSIRDFAKNDSNTNFYLLWFGLDIGTPVFWLMREGSDDFKMIDGLCNILTMGEREVKTYDDSDLLFPEIVRRIRARLERVSDDLQRQLVMAAEMDDGTKFKDTAIKKAKMYIQEIGRRGENLVNEYLDRMLFEHKILEYDWKNKSREQSLPYDFWIKYDSGREQWMDVKSTEKEFEQPVVVSNNEIKFITEKTNQEYAIYRVYSMEEASALLKVCSGCLKYVKKMQRDITYMTESMSDYQAKMINYKIAFNPSDNCFMNISEEMRIGN